MAVWLISVKQYSNAVFDKARVYLLLSTVVILTATIVALFPSRAYAQDSYEICGLEIDSSSVSDWSLTGYASTFECRETVSFASEADYQEDSRAHYHLGHSPSAWQSRIFIWQEFHTNAESFLDCKRIETGTGNEIILKKASQRAVTLADGTQAYALEAVWQPKADASTDSLMVLPEAGELLIVQGADRVAIVLGIFAPEMCADTHLASLERARIESVFAGIRPMEEFLTDNSISSSSQQPAWYGGVACAVALIPLAALVICAQRTASKEYEQYVSSTSVFTPEKLSEILHPSHLAMLCSGEPSVMETLSSNGETDFRTFAAALQYMFATSADENSKLTYRWADTDSTHVVLEYNPAGNRLPETQMSVQEEIDLAVTNMLLRINHKKVGLGKNEWEVKHSGFYGQYASVRFSQYCKVMRKFRAAVKSTFGKSSLMAKHATGVGRYTMAVLLIYVPLTFCHLLAFQDTTSCAALLIATMVAAALCYKASRKLGGDGYLSLLGTALRDASPQMSEWFERFAKGEEGENLTVDELSVLASYAAALEMSEQFGMGVVRRFGRELIDVPERLRFATPDVTHGNAIPLVWFTRDVVDAWSLAEELDWYVKTNGSDLLQ